MRRRSTPASSRCVANACRKVSPHYSSFVDSPYLLPPPSLLWSDWRNHPVVTTSDLGEAGHQTPGGPCAGYARVEARSARLQPRARCACATADRRGSPGPARSARPPALAPRGSPRYALGITTRRSTGCTRVFRRSQRRRPPCPAPSTPSGPSGPPPGASSGTRSWPHGSSTSATGPRVRRVTMSTKMHAIHRQRDAYV
jgi:hypothetical protein